MPGHHAGRIPSNKGRRYPPDPPKVDEIGAVIRQAGERIYGRRPRGLIVVLWLLPVVAMRRCLTTLPSTVGLPSSVESRNARSMQRCHARGEAVARRPNQQLRKGPGSVRGPGTPIRLVHGDRRLANGEDVGVEAQCRDARSAAGVSVVAPEPPPSTTPTTLPAASIAGPPLSPDRVPGVVTRIASVSVSGTPSGDISC